MGPVSRVGPISCSEILPTTRRRCSSYGIAFSRFPLSPMAAKFSLDILRVFAATSATIVSGAVSGRMRLYIYL